MGSIFVGLFDEEKMKIISINISKGNTISNKKGEFKTGIYKTSVNGPIKLGKTDVVGDTVADRKHHAGIDKACYIYSADYYPYWEKQFPDMDWANGMFGENLTVKGYNDLDVNTLQALEKAVIDFPGCAVIISHDRFFLDRVATHILAFEGNSKVMWFDGNFSDYEEDKKKRLGEDALQPKRIGYKKIKRD